MHPPYPRPTLLSSPRREAPRTAPHLSPVQLRLYGEVARTLRDARRRAGMDTRDIAEAVSRMLGAPVTHSTMRRAFEGSAHLSLDKLWALARVLQVPLASLLPCVTVDGGDA